MTALAVTEMCKLCTYSLRLLKALTETPRYATAYVWLSVILESLLYSYTFWSLIFFIVLGFIFCFSFKCYVLTFSCMHLSFLFNFVIFKMCICSTCKVLAFSFGSVFSCFNTTINCFCPHL